MLSILAQRQSEGVGHRSIINVFAPGFAIGFDLIAGVLAEATLRTGAHQLIVFRALRSGLARGGLFVVSGLALCIANSAFREWVREQKFRRFASKSIGLLHALKHPSHARGVKVGSNEGIQTNTVCLDFSLPAKAQLGSLAHGLGGCERGKARIRSPRDTDEDRRDGTHQSGNRRGLLCLNPPRKMALTEVGQFVGHDRRILVKISRINHQAQIDANDPARRGKGIEFFIVHDNDRLERAAKIGILHQIGKLGLHVVLKNRVAD